MKLRKIAFSMAVVVTSAMLPLVQAGPARATWGPGWNNLWVRAACKSYPLDNLEKFYVWAPNSPQGDKLFDPADTGLGAYTAYYHYDNVNKQVSGDTFLNYRVHCKVSNTVRTGQLRWGGGAGSTHWVTINA